jgi:1-acyl-sn-glycerol-3-phosphate acyltransferase
VTTATVSAAPSWVRRGAGPLARSWLRLDVRGAVHLPLTGGALIAANHTSHLDSIALGASSPRALHFLGAVHLTRVPVLGAALPRLGLIPVRRDEGDADALEQVTALLRAGCAVVVYPEGGRSRDGRVHRPRSGVARLAATTGCPVVPVGLFGTADVWPVGRAPRLRRGAVRVRYGAPLPPPDDTPAARRRFASDLHDALVELSGAPRADGMLPRSD